MLYFIGMFSEEVRSLLAEVITSWQVLAVTVVLIIYIFLVNYVAKTHHKSPWDSVPKPRQKAAKTQAAPEPGAVPDDDELGLEEPAKE